MAGDEHVLGTGLKRKPIMFKLNKSEFATKERPTSSEKTVALITQRSLFLRPTLLLGCDNVF